jgi:uncharacterized protein (TIGR03435 family)
MSGMRALALSCVVFTATLHGQMPTFEVASVKRAIAQNGAALPMMKCRGGAGTPDPTRLTCVNAPLSFLLCEAFGKEFYEVIGPDWMPLMAQGYDVTAIIPQGISKEQYLAMYQTLLVERFRLVLHHEMRDWPGYTLGVSKNGAKFRPSPESVPSNERFLRPVFSPGHVQVIVHGRSLDLLAKSFLHPCLHAPITNETGLQGDYDFTLDFQPDSTCLNAGYGPTSTGPDDWPDLRTALQTQLGLTLTQKKVRIDMLVIDHAEKMPAEN